MSADSAWVVLPFAAFFGAACAAFFNWSLQTFARKQVARDRVVADMERFCDELMKQATAYWSGENDRQTQADLELLIPKIEAHILLLSQFIKRYFDDNWELGVAMAGVQLIVTGGDYGRIDIPQDRDRSARAVGAIVGLRLAIAGAK